MSTYSRLVEARRLAGDLYAKLQDVTRRTPPEAVAAEIAGALPWAKAIVNQIWTAELLAKEELGDGRRPAA